MNIYRFPPVSSELVVSGGGLAANDEASSSLSSGLFRGLPSNEPVHVLVRIYVVKVRLCDFLCSLCSRLFAHGEQTKHFCVSFVCVFFLMCGLLIKRSFLD